ncbi:ArsR/SmtB family transcription factor [Patulibacter defluvii]|uniref:ArsR/SmtB family transcription factor n=1 Tax=Patulibacter defluvii TaxID=3095358 RepID=UPI002A74C5A3|nr:metalloregulator ArsR/SmtB family transcription factor [Patulibacter sp. DM4]
MRALAHEERRALLAACWERPRTAGELVERSALTAPSVSEHLKVLRKTGLLVLERQGRYRLYRADPEVLERVTAALGRIAPG